MHPHSHMSSGHHGHGHGHGHGGHQHGPGCQHAARNDTPPEQYMKNLQQMKQNGQYEFYWMEFIKGTYLQKKLQGIGIDCVGALNCNILLSIVGMFHMMLNCAWLPLFIRPFISGLFWPLIILLYLNHKILSGFNEQNTQQHQINIWILITPIITYALVALRGSGTISTSHNIQRGKKVIEMRPYLSAPNLKCHQCNLPKIFRTMHCPMCKQCIPKFSRHSLVFGICIGATNQLLALLFFVSLSIAQIYILGSFFIFSNFGALTKLMFYGLNLYILFISLFECFTLYILNFYYGVTQFQISAWVMLQYLMNVPQRQFKNTVNLGLGHNIKQSIYALLSIPGFQAKQDQTKDDQDQNDNQLLNQQIPDQQQYLDFPKLEKNKLYTVNWAKSFFYLIPHMPNHPLRDEVIQIMKKDQPRMIQNFKMMKKFREEVEAQSPGLSDLQKQQKTMMKMQQFVMKNGSPMKPPPEQQKIIQLQMLAHIKMQFKDQQQLYKQFDSIETRLKNNEIQPDEAAVMMRNMQQKVMEIKMKQVMKQQQQQQRQEMPKNIVMFEQKSTNKEQENKKKEESLQKAQSALQQGLPQQNPMMGNQMFRPPNMAMPSPEQQKAMQKVMISNMKKQFEGDQQIYAQLDSIQDNLNNDKMNPIQIAMAMRGIQQQIMQKKMAMHMNQMNRPNHSQQANQLPTKSIVPNLQPQKIQKQKSQSKNNQSNQEQKDTIQEISSSDLKVNQQSEQIAENKTQVQQDRQQGPAFSQQNIDEQNNQNINQQQKNDKQPEKKEQIEEGDYQLRSSVNNQIKQPSQVQKQQQVPNSSEEEQNQ